ncbi:MAG: DNA pilot protein [Microviridae sp.]|nr:MAG: DNA pilot protein [Microviridae sp.]
MAWPAVAAAGLQIGSSLLSSALNVSEGRKNRRFQRRMSNTAHQREVADLKKAGMNPTLTTGGGGSTTPSGSIIRVENPAAGAISSALDYKRTNIEKKYKGQAGSLAEESANTQRIQQGLYGAQQLKTQADTYNTLQSILESNSRVKLNAANERMILEGKLPGEKFKGSVYTKTSKGVSNLQKLFNDVRNSVSDPNTNMLEGLRLQQQKNRLDKEAARRLKLKRFKEGWKKTKGKYHWKKMKSKRNDPLHK